MYLYRNIISINRNHYKKGSIAEEAKKYLADNFLLDISEYDIIIGYRADDSYFSFAQDFVMGAISLQKLSEAMRLGQLGEQVVLKSEKAFEKINFLDYEAVAAVEYYTKKVTRDRDAQREYRKSKRTQATIQELYILDIMRENIKHGDPTYVAGMTGCELAKEVLIKCGIKMTDIPDEMYVDKSPEYWTGWALSYYQWYTAKPFSRIHAAVSIQQILMLYPALHEADLSQFVGIMNDRLRLFYLDTNLKRIRKYAGLSQSELSVLSKVPLRQIQLFEQRQRDINKTQAITLLQLSRALGCKSEDLMEL